MANTDRSLAMSGDGEKEVAQIVSESIHHSGQKRGGWVTFPFFIGTSALLTLASFGWVANLIVYLIEEFNVKNIDAAQINNIVNGCVNFIPVIAAVFADSFLGSFSLISISSCISLLGVILLTLTGSIASWSPQQCVTNDTNGPTTSCHGGSTFQLAVLYAGIALSSAGAGGFRFALTVMGADQFDKPKAQGIYINWYFITFYAAQVVSFSAIVFVQDNVSWGLGFGLCAVANFLGLAIFLSGTRFYRKVKPQGSPFTGLARVVVAAFRKRKLAISPEAEDYHHLHGNTVTAKPRNSLRFFNRAAQKTEGDIKPDGSVGKPWKLCSVQQVEDFKTIIRILPLWSSTILLGTPIAIQIGLTILQALTMDRHLGNSNFKIPAGSLIISSTLSSTIFIGIIDRFLIPTWQKLTGQLPTPLQRIGVGHVLNVLSMAVSAIVESKRLKTHENNPELNIVPMSVVLLFPQFMLVGIGEAFHFPGQVSLYYQEFPASLRNMSTGVLGLLIGIAFYLSTALIDLIQRVTGWLPDDINKGRLDNVYWVVVVLGVINFVYYLVCAKLYKYQNVETERMRVEEAQEV